MKKNLLLATILLGGVVFAQTGKVGIQTENPTETLQVEGTVRITDLPTNGKKKAIYTDTNGGNTNDKTQPFNATKTVVVDKNGVLGTVDVVPVIPEKSEEGTETTKIKQLIYAVNSIGINEETPTESETCLSNICVRFNGTNPSAGEVPVQYRVIANKTNKENVNIFAEKYGTGGANFRSFSNTDIDAGDHDWKNFGQSPNVRNKDMAAYRLAFLRSKELYRVNVSCTPKSNDLPEGNVTIYIERMGYND